MSSYTGKYHDQKASFDRDKAAFNRAAEGDGKRPSFPDSAGGMSDRRKPVDSDLKYSGGNEGYTGGNEK
jgi:hypothetical protein